MWAFRIIYRSARIKYLNHSFPIENKIICIQAICILLLISQIYYEDISYVSWQCCWAWVFISPTKLLPLCSLGNTRKWNFDIAEKRAQMRNQAWTVLNKVQQKWDSVELPLIWLDSWIKVKSCLIRSGKNIWNGQSEFWSLYSCSYIAFISYFMWNA